MAMHVSETILKMMLLPTLKLYDRGCCVSLEARYLKVTAKRAAAGIDLQKRVSFLLNLLFYKTEKVIKPFRGHTNIAEKQLSIIT